MAGKKRMEQQNPESTLSKSLDELQADLESVVEASAEIKEEIIPKEPNPAEASPAEEGAKVEEPSGEGIQPPEVEAPIDPLLVAQTLARENYDKYLRTAAELDTFRRRAQKERSDLLKYGGESMARDLLEVLDNLERAITAATSATSGTAGSGGEEFISGIKMIAEQYRQVFDRHGVRGESGIGQLFDPAKQEALASVPSDDKPVGEVIEEFRKTYFFKDKLLRTGQVVVTAAKSSE